MSQQGARQADVRFSTGTAYDYNGDWMALFDQAGIAAGDFDGRLLAWINVQLGTSYTEVNGAMQAFAEAQGAFNWSSLGTVPVFLPTAALALDFVNGRYRNGVGSSYSTNFAGLTGLTVTRASVGYAERLDGSLVQFASNVARITNKGLLVEEARTNLLPNSTAFTTTGGASTVATNIDAPDGSLTATRLALPISAGVDLVRSSSAAVTPSAPYTGAMYVRGPAGQTVTLVTKRFGGATGATSPTTVLTMNGQWQRVTNLQVTLAADSTGGGVAILGSSAAQNVDVWGAQFESGLVQSSSYIPTTGASATRPADQISIAGIASQTGTLYVQALVGVLQNFNQYAGFSDAAAPGTLANRITIGNSTNATAFRITGAGADTFVADTTAPTSGAVSKAAMSWASGGSALASLGGVTVAATTNTGVVPATATFLELGSGGAPTPYLNSYLRSVVFKATQDSQAALNAGTQ